jgi:hypothetical protein
MQQLKTLKARREERHTYFFQGIFLSVFHKYQEASATLGAVPCVSLESSQQGKSSNSKGSGHVRPTRIDFVSDVEITAKKILSRPQFRLFVSMINKKLIPETGKYAAIEELLGEAFKRYGIYPLKEYFKEKYIVPER